MTCVHCGRTMPPTDALEVRLKRKEEGRIRVRYLHRKAVSPECWHGFLGKNPTPTLGRNWRPAA